MNKHKIVIATVAATARATARATIKTPAVELSAGKVGQHLNASQGNVFALLIYTTIVHMFIYICILAKPSIYFLVASRAHSLSLCTTIIKCMNIHVYA